MEMDIRDLNGAAVTPEQKYLLLDSLQAKDLTDSTAEILREHLIYALPFKNNFREDIFQKYVLCPRIEAVDMITSYRKFISEFFDDSAKKNFRQNPRELWQWITENIKNADEYRTDNDHRVLSASPAGMLTYKLGGEHSRKILFTAICRSLGIAARLNNRDGSMEYYTGEKFVKVAAVNETAPVSLSLIEKNNARLEYYGNFSVKRLVNTSAPYFFGCDATGNSFDLAPGHYQVLTGRRLESGAMSVKTFYVHLTKDTTLEVEVPPEENTAPQPKPIADYDFDNDGLTLNSLLTGKDLVACVRPSHEPTEHLLKELIEAREDYKRLGVRLILVTLKENDTLKKVKIAFAKDITVIYDTDDAFGKFLAEQTGLNAPNLPVIALIKDGSAVYRMQGYNVGSAAMALTYV
jgi:hypothetical protein